MYKYIGALLCRRPCRRPRRSLLPLLYSGSLRRHFGRGLHLKRTVVEIRSGTILRCKKRNRSHTPENNS